MQQRLELVFGGTIQGVGFRPFVFRIANDYQLDGWVRNESGQVRIQVQGRSNDLIAFKTRLLHEAPATASPNLLQELSLRPTAEQGFLILPSSPQGNHDIHVPVDLYLCDDCRKELNDNADRRHNYPFINCTACGPRYSIINAIPYDRCNTSMSGFTLCKDCQREYNNPIDRRFHAEPIACAVCGPRIYFATADKTLFHDQALNACLDVLQRGELAIIKGIGGYHICCDATNAQAIEQLRQRKQRPHKPLAIMFPAVGEDELDSVRRYFELNEAAKIALRSAVRPIVLLKRRAGGDLAPNLAPNLEELGAMLPYSPLHSLLLSRFNKPIVATSANISGEPVLTEEALVKQRLSSISQYFLHHNRAIARPVDDPVLRIINGQARPLRLGRGSAPLQLTLSDSLPYPILACGGHIKNSVALAWQNQVVVSPHIGDLDSARSQQVFAQTILDLQSLYQIKAEVLIHDKHPDYFSTRWARRSGLATIAIAHHHAHAAVLAGEYPEQKNWLVFTWDGIGLGENNTLCGGEAFYGSAGQWRHCASWRPFKLPGGERAAREPWRSALSLCWETNTECELTGVPDNSALLQQAWRKNHNSPLSSSVGRLFDAAAALLDISVNTSFEGQAAMYLEQLASHGQHPGLRLALHFDGAKWCSDWSPLLPLLNNDKLSRTDRAYAFHATLANALIDQADHIRRQHGDFALGLCGGVFQNKLLCELVSAACAKRGWPLFLPRQIPLNDGGLCYGQVIEALALINQGTCVN